VHAGKANTTPGPNEGGKGEFDLTARAVAFIEQHRDQPFFLYLAHNTPHIPLAARQELIPRYAGAFNPVYAAMIETLDETVGMVLDALVSAGLEQQTLVIFTSDNGGLHVLESPDSPATHNTPYRAGKGFVYEGGVRVPLIVRWPGGIAGGRVADDPVISMDLLPTLVDLCGLEPPELCDGMSLADLLRHNQRLGPRALYWHQPHYSNQGGRPAGAVREGAWKLIEHYEDGRIELYNLEQDPSETVDASGTEAATAERLRGLLHAWLDEVGAQRNLPNPAFDAQRHRLLYVETDVSRLAPAATAAEIRHRLAAWRQAMNQAVR
jgi:arylsulfatase A-like enzyme